MRSPNSIAIRLSFTEHSHLSQISILHYGSLEKQFEDLAQKFIRVAPWTAWPPLDWRLPITDTDETMPIAFVNLSDDTREVMLSTIQQINRINRHTLDNSEITPSIFLNTAIYWWLTFVYPPRQPQPLHS